jgi:hypothetical protein
MGAKVVIQFQGVEETISRLNQIEEKAQQNIINEMGQISDDGKSAWKEATPKGKTKQLSGDEDATPADLSITFTSPTYYYKFVDEGHRVRKRGGGYAKRRVEGRYMTKALVEWLKENMTRYLSKFLDNV